MLSCKCRKILTILKIQDEHRKFHKELKLMTTLNNKNPCRFEKSHDFTQNLSLY
jgi:hypothetical protein